MNKKVIVLVMASILALVAGSAVVLYANNANARAAAGQKPKEVWTVAKDIPRGTVLSDAKANGSLVKDVWATRAVPTTAELTLGADNLVASTDLSAKQILLKGQFVPADSMGPRLLNIPAGKIAVSAELKSAQKVGSFVQPGDFVAVFQYSQDAHQTTVLFPRAQVLGVGGLNTATNEVSKDKQSTAGTVMTLALSPAEATRLVTVTNSGTYQLQFGLLPAKGSVPAALSYGGVS